ncbi:MAG TPA: MurR/RpiR family transcriptional regulator [Casimicrobiaceae bacterium]|nr:MurR/RpiR family transcriptional regulator [Casimicrobiaceae bacterium]
MGGARATTYDNLRDAITDRYAALPRQLQRVAEVALERPHDLALKTVAVLADDAGVQPSTLVRFANAMGFGGFSAMQEVFRTHLLEVSLPYRERIARMRAARANGGNQPADILHGFIAESISGLEHLPATLAPGTLDAAVRLIANAQRIDVLAYRRSFPVACYLAYALNQLELSAQLLNGVGGMNEVYARRLGRKDALIVVSFRNYTAEGVAIATACHARGVSVLAITDGPLSPLKPIARVCLEIGDDGRKPFRSLVEPMCLAQALVVSVGHRMADRGKVLRRTH